MLPLNFFKKYDFIFLTFVRNTITTLIAMGIEPLKKYFSIPSVSVAPFRVLDPTCFFAKNIMKDETVLCVSKFTAALSRDTISDKKARERERTIISTILGNVESTIYFGNQCGQICKNCHFCKFFRVFWKFLRFI